MADIRHVIHHGGRADDVGLGVDLFLFLAGVQVDHVQQRVAPAERCPPGKHRRRTVDVVRRLVVPLLFAGHWVKCVQLEIVTADDQRWLGVLALGLKKIRRTQHTILGFKFPKQLTVLGIQRVDKTVGRTEVHFAIPHQRRGLHNVLRLERPNLFAGLEVERVQLAVVAADEHPAVGDRRRAVDAFFRLECPELLERRTELAFREAGQRGGAAIHRPTVRRGGGDFSGLARRLAKREEQRKRGEYEPFHDIQRATQKSPLPGIVPKPGNQGNKNTTYTYYF